MPTVVKLVTPPAEEPLTVAEAKAHLRVTFDDDDALVTRLVSAARRLCEVYARATFVNTTFDLVLDDFPCTGGLLDRNTRQFYAQFAGMNGRAVWPGLGAPAAAAVPLPRAPVVSVTSVSYVDASGSTQTLSPSLYTVATGSPGRIAPVFGQIWPVTYPTIGAVAVRFVAGYGADASAVPENVKAAILLMVGHLYENREAVVAGTGMKVETLPMAVEALLGVEDNSGGYA